MTIDQAYKYIQFVFFKRYSGYVAPADFNNLIDIHQISFINDRLGNVKKYNKEGRPPYGFGMTQKTREELRPLLVAPSTIAVSSGLAAIPSDYLYYDTVSVNGKQAQEATEDEILELNNSLIKPPSVTYPKFVVHQNGLYLFPTSITSILLSYVSKPTTPVWNYTITNDEPEYNSSGSQDWQTAPGTHLEICRRILADVGISLGLVELAQYADAAEAEGK